MLRNSLPTLVSSCLALLLGLSWAQRPVAQGQDERSQRPPFATVDMAKLFNADKEYVAERDRLQKEVAEAQKTFNEKQQALLQLREEARRAKPESAEQKRLAEELQAKAKELEMFRQNHIQQVIDAEKGLNIKTHRTLLEQISRYAETHDIKLVLRYSSQAVDEERTHQEVLALINQNVVYQNTLDITEEILQSLN